MLMLIRTTTFVSIRKGKSLSECLHTGKQVARNNFCDKKNAKPHAVKIFLVIPATLTASLIWMNVYLKPHVRFLSLCSGDRTDSDIMCRKTSTPALNAAERIVFEIQMTLCRSLISNSLLSSTFVVSDIFAFWHCQRTRNENRTKRKIS